MDIFIQLSIILLIVLGVSFIMKLLKQPLIIGYIISGIMIGPFFINFLPDKQMITTFSEFGIAFLLFIVGLHLSPRVVKEVGKISLITGIGQVVFTSAIGYFIGLWLGFSPITAIYIAVALTFSSTIIIMKLLSDKEALDKLYGKISIGFLLVQDLIAIILLMIVSSFSSGGRIENILLSTFIKGAAAIVCLFPISYFLLPKLSNFFARSQELLFVFAISWGLGLSALFYFMGFSIEIGALIGGIMLSMSAYSLEISSKLRPLRDFFIISFFILLGSQMVFGSIVKMIFPAIVLSLFILIGNPLIVMILMGFFGYSKSTGFMAGLTVAQISEFSLILIALGTKVGHISQEVLSFVTIIGLVTIAGSTYMITYSEKIYSRISGLLGIFERRKIKDNELKDKRYDYILFGENRMGFSILKYLRKADKNYLIVDFNPARVKELCSRGVSCIYGDVSNMGFIEDIGIEKTKLVISTIPDIATNMLVLRRVRENNKDAVVILTSSQRKDALLLYESGADYVILPQFISGEFARKLIEKSGTKRDSYKKQREEQIKSLKERFKDNWPF